jgi:hypothetical protein
MPANGSAGLPAAPGSNGTGSIGVGSVVGSRGVQR